MGLYVSKIYKYCSICTKIFGEKNYNFNVSSINI